MLTDRSRRVIADRRFARAALACSSLAIAVALTSVPVRAQSFQGNGVFAAGSGTISTPTPTTTVIDLTSSDAVINWSVFSGLDTTNPGVPIIFQPSGTTATFQRASDFSVLNRILPTDQTRPIQFDGNIVAQIQSTTTAPGGSVYFYSPGGVFVGSTAVFNVGNLGLTSIDPEVVGGVFEQPGAPGDEFVRFNGAVTANSAVRVVAGAQINATGAANNSYVALVAPVVDQRGTINVNGQAALVSADAATITFSPSGLFDIQVTSGTSAVGAALSNSGTITGPAYQGAGALHRIYAVAVPKNTAITLLVLNGSQLGFNIAGAADIVGNSVVLSAGHNITAGAIDPANTNPALAVLSVDDQGGSLGFSSAVNARGSTVQLQSSGSLSFASDASLIGQAGVSFNAPGGAINVGGNLSIATDSLLPQIFSNPDGAVASVAALSGGTINVTGNVVIDASAMRDRSGNSSVEGGSAQLSANGAGSTISIGGNAMVLANAIDLAGLGIGATGGQASLSATGNGTVTIAGQTTMRSDATSGPGASATGGSAIAFAQSGGTFNFSNLTASANGSVQPTSTPGIDGFNGTGGIASLRANGIASTIAVSGTALLEANGFGGTGNCSSCSEDGGIGMGGTAELRGSQTAHSITIGSVSLSARGVGGQGFASASGDGRGGFAYASAENGTTINVTGSLNSNASGTAGAGINGFRGGLGRGGTSLLQTLTGGDLLVGGPVQLNTIGFGGAGGTGAAGGMGSGGTSQIFARDPGSSVTINNQAQVLALGIGGVGNGAAGGTGTGGQAFVNAQVAGGSTIAISGATSIQAIGTGGNANGGPGGTGLGGTAVAAASVNNSVQFGSTLDVFGFGVGGNATGGNAGSATGGTARIVLFSNGTMSVGGLTRVISNGFTGSGNPNSALAQGGTTSVEAQQNSTLTVTGALAAFSGGIGSGATPTIGTGSGQGGTTTVLAATGGSIGTTIGLFAASGGVGADGGTGKGGNVVLQLNGGTLSGGQLSLDVQGTGGNIAAAASGNGGIGTGGSASINVGAGTNTLTFNLISLSADGVGGNNSGTAGSAGAGVGGFAQISVFGGSTLTVNAADTDVDAFGVGGNSSSLNGNGGAGNGGRALISVDGGNANFNGNISAYARSIGGAGINGGTAFGDPESTLSRAFVFARNGSLAVTGSAVLRATADGGTGNLAGNGGNATGGLANVVAANGVNTTGFGVITLGDLDIDSGAQGGTATGTGNGGDAGAGRAHLFVNGGTVSVSGGVELFSEAYGGDGINGGNAISAQPFRQPRALIGSFNGTITVAGFSQLSATAFGGDGLSGFGGTGGIAFAGIAAVDAQSNNGPSTISLTDLEIDASAFGGDGGGAGPSTTGGIGGEAYGGITSAFGNAGQGTLNVSGETSFFASAFGGDGGNGHPGTTTGTNGGSGGRAIGGGITVGMVSGLDTPSNTGSSTFDLVFGDVSAFGGNGGDGGSGTTQGNGGAGGTGFGGFAGILVRGSPATFTDVDFVASGFGGDGGLGAVQGDGGDGYAGDTNLTVTQRFNRTERGTLTANDITFAASGIGGAGATAGDSFFAASEVPEGEFFVRQGDVSLGSFTLTYGGTLAPNVSTTILQVVDDFGIPVPTPITVTADAFDISLMSGNVDIAGSLSIVTPSTMRLSLDSSTLDVANLTLSASNFVLPAVRPATLGTINVSGSLSLSSALDFLAYANFNVGFAGTLGATGSVLTGDLIFNGPLDIAAGGSITTGNIQASDVALDAGANLATGAISTGGAIDLVATGAITTGLLTAGDTVEANAGGALNVAGASAGIVNPSTSTAAEFNVGLRSLTSVVAGDVSARASFGVSSPGSIAVGNVSVGQVFLALPGTSLTTGSISTALTPGSRVYIGNYSMEALGGQVTSNFDPAPILAVTPVATGGPIAINGPVSTIVLQANTLQSITASGTIQTPGATVLVAGTTINAADIVVGDRAIVAAGGNIVLGNVNAGLTIPSNGLRKIAIGSSGNVTTGNLAAMFDLGIQAGGGISTGTLLGRQILLLAGTNVSTAAVSAVVGTQPIGQFYIGNFSMASPTANVFSQFQSPTAGPLAIFNIDPVKTGGSITLGGSVLAGNVSAGAGTGFTASAIAASNDIDIEAGGLASVNGAWSSFDIDVISDDIAIASTGSLTASATGEILLASTNSAGMFVGDGLTPGSGYALSNDEFSRVRAGEIDIVGTDFSGLATDLTIGNLTINVSQLLGADGLVLFASGNRETETPSGILRIAGAVVGNGFAPTNEIELLSGTVEIEAANGSLKVNAGSSDSGSTSGTSSLGGLIFVEADHIHVASDAILTKLRADPLYTGHIDELNAPAAVQRPDGVFNALGFEVSVGETFYIQNTGSRIVPAGFLTNFDNTEVFASGDRTGGTEIVINGQFQTSTGTVTGKAAFDQVVADASPGEDQFFGFSESSQLNGCVFLSGVCAFGSSTQMAPPASEISVIISPVLATSPPPPAVEEAGPGDSSASSSDSEAAAEDADSSEEEKKDDGDGDEAASPIAPPAPLISTRALDGDVNVVEPVSGAGNPALFGSAVDETTVQGVKP